MQGTRKIPGAGDALTLLDGAIAAMRREVEAAEADPFDDAMVAAVAGLADALKSASAALADVGARFGGVGRRT